MGNLSRSDYITGMPFALSNGGINKSRNKRRDRAVICLPQYPTHDLLLLSLTLQADIRQILQYSLTLISQKVSLINLDTFALAAPMV